MNYNVIFAPEASDDLENLLAYLIDEAGPETARSYVGKIVEYCLSFKTFPKRGALRDDLRPELRVAARQASRLWWRGTPYLSCVSFIAAKTSASTIISKRRHDRQLVTRISRAQAQKMADQLYSGSMVNPAAMAAW
ncbi:MULTISPECIES: type II toxin-antitoxin system RelE/ParE family toxin [Rhizobium]|jgi:plasmid stabilization system protein ParE|uniref:Plasmid stabilization system protein ParE n=1 Tax=Rhizobium esperanzae TaxID=1967781 RepID=A0A7W6URB4_9HYPH|nr:MULTISPECIES: type II toxin-antitoxin system RelE/ParE family toxin [Rhizobium]MBB4442900.1 plasmid stabilization system protein ParE [Rhizobium esperanzae]MDH6205671.1 plasmid stabilization system protein ParE [Rhizobium leguminosarum]